ncbi:MAG TPA: FumA C-terminus/TtdB family hydratase beta subunit [Ruminiclostridium sp.]|nr:FumA C-terminus/TtdB family hydratase beta subunit [Ruminiclostridium sp.]
MPSEPIKINTSELKSRAKDLRAGSRILLSGTVYTSRDAAHKRITELMKNDGKLPFELNGAAIYYAGPTGTPKNRPIGSCGPTTSSRMDVFAPAMLDAGLSAMIGKGERDEKVCEAIERNGAVYLCALGGAGALACRCITSCEIIAFEDLGCESVKKLTFCDFPLFVAIDSMGGNIFKEGREKWQAN